MKRILITGGSGFIGTNLIEHFLSKEGYDMLNIDIAPPKIDTHIPIWRNVDIRNKALLVEVFKDFQPNMIIHLAARTDLRGHTIEDYDTNTTGVQNLIEILKVQQNIDRVLFASSMYVCKPGYKPKNFDDYAPHTIYGESKVQTEIIIKESNLNIPWTIFRPTSIWGPWFGEPYIDFFKIVLSGNYFHMGSKACKKTYGYIGNTVCQIESIMFFAITKLCSSPICATEGPGFPVEGFPLSLRLPA